MDGSMIRLALILALSSMELHAVAAGVMPYFESSANQTKPLSNAGVSLGGDRVSLKADLALRAPNNQTQIVPHFSSAFALSPRLGLETRYDMAEWNTRAELPGAKFDTRFHYRSSAPFLDVLEGSVWRSPNGQSGRVLNFGFYQILRESNAATAAVTIRSKATVETSSLLASPTLRGIPAPSIGNNLAALGNPLTDPLHAAVAAAYVDSRRVGIETEVAGLMSALPGRAALRLKLERVGGARPETASTVAYDHSWRVWNFAQFGVNVKMLRATYSTANDVQPSLGLTWRAEF